MSGELEDGTLAVGAGGDDTDYLAVRSCTFIEGLEGRN